jgi:hypothetical protein
MSELYDPLLPQHRMVLAALIARPPADAEPARAPVAVNKPPEPWFDWVAHAIKLVEARTPFRLAFSSHSQRPEGGAWYLLAPKDSPIREDLETAWLQVADRIECDEWQVAVQVALSFEYAPLSLDDERARALDELARMERAT